MLRKFKDRIGSRSPSPAQSTQPHSPAQSSQSPVLETARNVCVLVSNLGSGALNVPGLQAAGQIGCQIIDIVQKMKDNEDAYRSLIGHIELLMNLIYSALPRDGTNIDNMDIDAALKSDAEKLQRSLEDIFQTLQGLASRSRARKLLGSAGDAGEITKCRENIDFQIKAFNLSSLLYLREGQTSINRQLGKLISEESVQTSLAPPSPQPVPSELFYGRKELVSELANLFRSNEQQKIAILGAGGLGKTTLALHLLHDPLLVEMYGTHRFFVGCDGVTSANALALQILQILQASCPVGGSPIDALSSELDKSPTLLLLDNFESIWYAQEDHKITRDLLTKIAGIKNTSLIITMRATNPPAGVLWSLSSILPPLSPAPARELFLSINPTFCRASSSDADEQILDELLKEVDYVPLAIHLLAQVSLDFSPSSTQEQWREKRTQMLKSDQFPEDRLENVDVSIALSITALDIVANPDTIQLLGMLSLLPDGLFRYEERLKMIGETFHTTTDDLRRLRRFALVYTSGDKLAVLSPIRYFVLQHFPPDTGHVHCVHNIFWKLVGTYATVNFGPERNSANEALRPEIGNISNLIEHAVRYYPTERILDVAIDMSWHFYGTHPSTDILEMVSPLEQTADPAVRARFWEISGQIAYQQDRYTEATSSFTQARAHFLDTGNHLKVAHCSYRLGDILHMQDQYPVATALLTQARDEFLALDDPTGLGRCLKGLGDVLYMQEKYPEASAMLTEARDQFLKVGDHLGATQCLQSLGDVLFMQSEYSEASFKLTEARREFLAMGEGVGAAHCLKTLGNILQGEQKYDEASEALKEARAEFLKLGSRLGAAQCLRILGAILVTQKIFSDASATLTEALYRSRDIGDRLEEYLCLEFLGENLLAQGQRTEGEPLLFQARDLFLEIGMERQAARCSWKIEHCIASEAEESVFREDGLSCSAEQSETEREDAEGSAAEGDE
ncbi:hypothetical protein HWV62_1124 [Athelia sp. TMB]|nr:hypothetical protein HWV62_1124 [Athelia sp. TMB]